MSFIVLDSRYIANSRKVEEAIFATCYHFYYPIFLLLATSTSWRSGRLIFSDMARKVIPYFQPTDSSSWTERFSGVSFQLAKQILINSRYLKQYYIQYGVALTSQHYFRRPPDDFLGRLQGSCSTTVGPPGCHDVAPSKQSREGDGRSVWQKLIDGYPSAFKDGNWISSVNEGFSGKINYSPLLSSLPS